MARRTGASRTNHELIVVLFAALVYLPGILSPPSLMDDVDAVQAQIARNMLESGDWVTARLDGVAYLEKSPMKYWSIAVSYMIFGVHDWAARIPLALSTILLCWVTTRFGMWAFSARAGLFAGIVLATCTGLWLFTRILIPDVMLTLTITVAMWGFLRTIDDSEARPRLWAWLMAASIGIGLLLKGLIAAVLPVGGALLYLAVTRRLTDRAAWRRLHPFSGLFITLLIAAPWHILATARNPPYLDFTMNSEPGAYRGFFWFYFMNEHVLRFLNMRYPRDYNTVPRLYFWLFHLLWLFPWSVFFPQVAKLSYRPVDRGGRARLLAACWAGFLLVFFTLSTTQEYYSMPCYPALALLLGCALAAGGNRIAGGMKAIVAVAGLAALVIAFILAQVWSTPAPGDIASALSQNPDLYTLSLGHMADLTLPSFAYLKLPLALAGFALIVGIAGAWGRSWLGPALMMALFFVAAKAALIVFDPYLSSRPLARVLNAAPPGELIVDGPYYTFSSVFFYTNRRALLVNGRVNNLEYGSYAPGAPQVFIDDSEFARVWSLPGRRYVVTEGPHLPRIERLAGKAALYIVGASGGKFLFSNRP